MIVSVGTRTIRLANLRVSIIARTWAVFSRRAQEFVDRKRYTLGQLLGIAIVVASLAYWNVTVAGVLLGLLVFAHNYLREEAVEVNEDHDGTG